jgi:hypothetical protein
MSLPPEECIRDCVPLHFNYVRQDIRDMRITSHVDASIPYGRLELWRRLAKGVQCVQSRRQNM